MPDKGAIEHTLENGLFASRWLMAPMYLGLVVALAMLTVVFGRELLYYAPKVLTMTTETAILACLTLIDLTLAANLLLIVMFSGYENFVSKLDVDVGKDKPAWMGTVDFAGLKMKLIASIIAISGIALLKQFMEIGTEGHETLQERELYWLVLIHLTFVASGVFMAVMDWLVGATNKKGY
jgi:uncharacterized protein (TIGR00645 family)